MFSTGLCLSPPPARYGLIVPAGSAVVVPLPHPPLHGANTSLASLTRHSKTGDVVVCGWVAQTTTSRPHCTGAPQSDHRPGHSQMIGPRRDGNPAN